jgi:hypothetical protein
VQGNRLVFVASPGESNELTIAPVASAYHVADAGAPVRAGAGCHAKAGVVTCTLGGVAGVFVDLGDGSDSVRLAALTIPAEVAAGPGDDLVIAGSGDDVVLGGAGDDTVYGGDGSDLIYGGDGEDYLSGGPGANIVDGGAGNDSIVGGAGDDLLSGGPDDDEIAGGDGNDQLYGGDGNDGLFGGPGADMLYGGPGNDSLVGGPGGDFVFGEDGVDSTNALDGEPDVIDCGGQSERVYADDFDSLIACLPFFAGPELPAAARPVPLLPVTTKLVAARLVRILVKAESRVEVHIRLRFLNRRGRALGSVSHAVWTNQWQGLRDIHVPRGTRKVSGSCCR